MRDKFKKWLAGRKINRKFALGAICLIFGWGTLFGVLVFAPQVDLGPVTLFLVFAIIGIFWYFGPTIKD